MAKLFYPHGVYFLGATFLGQADDVSADLNLDELSAYATGDVMPGFTGGKKTEPEFRCDTMDLSSVFTILSSGDEDFVRAMSAGNVDLMFRQSKNQAMREPVGDSKHVVYRLIQSGMFFWDSFEVSQDGEAKINTRIAAAYRTGVPTVTLLSNQAVPASPDVTKLYTVGKVYVNGTALSRIKKIAWNNNPTVEKEAADGEGQPAHVCIGKTKPVIQIDMQDLDQLQAFTEDGLPLDGVNGVKVYLRRRQQGKINYPDASAVHIRLTCLKGAIFWTRTSGEKAAGQISIALQRPAGGGAVWAVTQDVAIP